MISRQIKSALQISSSWRHLQLILLSYKPQIKHPVACSRNHFCFCCTQNRVKHPFLSGGSSPCTVPEISTNIVLTLDLDHFPSSTFRHFFALEWQHKSKTKTFRRQAFRSALPTWPAHGYAKLPSVPWTAVPFLPTSPRTNARPQRMQFVLLHGIYLATSIRN